jgi:hypothetical protein
MENEASRSDGLGREAPNDALDLGRVDVGADPRLGMHRETEAGAGLEALA